MLYSNNFSRMLQLVLRLAYHISLSKNKGRPKEILKIMTTMNHCNSRSRYQGATIGLYHEPEPEDFTRMYAHVIGLDPSYCFTSRFCVDCISKYQRYNLPRIFGSFQLILLQVNFQQKKNLPTLYIIKLMKIKLQRINQPVSVVNIPLLIFCLL